MRTFTWRCPYCEAERTATIGPAGHGTERWKLRSRLISHFSACPKKPGIGERSREADRMVAGMLGLEVPA